MNKAIIISLIISVPSYANNTDFNMSFVHGSNTITPQFYSHNKSYIPGTYLVKVYVNGLYTGEERLVITKNQLHSLHFSLNWLTQAGVLINPAFYQDYYQTTNHCYALSLEPNTNVNFNAQTQHLSFEIPQQGLLEKRKEDQLDEGSTAAMLQYYISANKYSGKKANISVSNNFSLNYEAWRLIGNANLNKTNINVPNIELKRDIKTIKSDFTVGNSNTYTQFYPSFSYTGAALYSNNNMTPWQQRGYAPIISGSVNKNATITVSQNGYVIKKLNVVPGPYLINNIQAISNGKITVKVVTNDGKVSLKHYTINQLSTLLRPKSNQYYLSIGTKHHSTTDDFAELEVSHGSSIATFTAGGITANNYQNMLSGITLPLDRFGAVSFINKMSHAHYNSNIKNNGDQLAINYSNDVSERNFIQLELKRNTNKDYIDYSEFEPNQYEAQKDNFKNKYSANYELELPTLNSSIQSHLWYSTNYNHHYQHGFDIYLNSNFHQFYINSAININKANDDAHTNYAVSLSLNFPLTANGNTYSSSTINATKGSQVYSTGISKTVNNRFNYSIYGDYSRDNNFNTSLSSSYTFDATQLNTNISQGQRSTNSNLELSGSVIGIHNHQNNYILFNHNTASTVAIAYIPQISDITFNGSTPTDHDGLTLVPLTSYENNLLTINPSEVPNNISLNNTAYSMTPTDGAIVFKKFGYTRTYTYLLQVYAKNGLVIPFGSMAYDNKHNTIGFSQNHGVLIVRTHAPHPQISINTGTTLCHISTQTLKDQLDTIQEVHCA
ncbi:MULTISPECIES: fimbria/pilus outer membrane usher protein [unclassified Photobacterium]|uniref:fimbria/pilus outer membrane usher protein n=1 Tax=unclassified Photobacterium TaxID=2628852 RepID=UPI001EDD398F|nr:MULTISPECIES: fimbria/pilus outer membrane usher protein [unclassified Photobacterium]MCG3862986.1 fimbria/pilus outer membrane usher protein [Photobacterium sp. Ph6]MCG3874517.1 fimbria/pilus outer membrane usher protein [Photobacterium sp. Ph5]